MLQSCIGVTQMKCQYNENNSNVVGKGNQEGYKSAPHGTRWFFGDERYFAWMILKGDHYLILLLLKVLMP